MTTKSAVVKQIQGITFAAKSDSNHWVIMDGSEKFGGSDAGNSPKELLLVSLGGCTGSDVASILSKKRVKIDKFEMNISAEVADEHPKVYTKAHIEYVFYGRDIQEKDVERAIELSQNTYCSVTAMLQKAFPIDHSYKIIQNEPEKLVMN